MEPTTPATTAPATSGSHFVCTGGCGGTSPTPGVCQSATCAKHGQPLTECHCSDNAHSEVSAASAAASVTEQPVAPASEPAAPEPATPAASEPAAPAASTDQPAVAPEPADKPTF